MAFLNIVSTFAVINQLQKHLQPMKNDKIYWSGTKSELIELCYALYSSKCIEDFDGKSQSFKKICQLVFNMFGLVSPINPDLRIWQMRKRKKKEASSWLYKSFKKTFDC